LKNHFFRPKRLESEKWHPFLLKRSPTHQDMTSTQVCSAVELLGYSSW
jgi:hypothetical protein